MPVFALMFDLRLVALVTALLVSATALARDDKATYELTIDITWGAENAPFEYPEGGGHLSRLVGATHRKRYFMFRDGHTASSGLESLSEVGRPDILKAELAEAQSRSRAGSVFELPRLDKVPGKLRITFEAMKEHPLLSFVTMLAPSPDWFTGVSDIPLAEDGKWINAAEVPLWAWDAGTDSGETYVAPNADTQPRQSVRLLATPHFLGADGLVSVGSAKLKRLR